MRIINILAFGLRWWWLQSFAGGFGGFFGLGGGAAMGKPVCLIYGQSAKAVGSPKCISLTACHRYTAAQL